jgi:ATPase components of ABC transporters with duplicated ATPase domains
LISSTGFQSVSLQPEKIKQDMVLVDGLAVEFGGTALFSDISFAINPQDRIALMGKNGAGKSTLLKILTGVREPTNHLDLKTKDILKQALVDFDGTLIVVSHDRDFLNGLVKKVYEFGNQKVTEHLEDIYGFLAKKKIENLLEIERK